MSDQVECPFCGLWFNPEYSHPGALQCPVSGYSFPREQWNTRPPRKEQPPTPAVESEVHWLRSLVEHFVEMKVVNITLPNNVKVSEGKE